jgi:hypothetical protein
MKHKRKRPKNRRAGCLLCKPWKSNELKDSRSMETRAMKRRRVEAEEGIRGRENEA